MIPGSYWRQTKNPRKGSGAARKVDWRPFFYFHQFFKCRRLGLTLILQRKPPPTLVCVCVCVCLCKIQSHIMPHQSGLDKTYINNWDYIYICDRKSNVTQTTSDWVKMIRVHGLINLKNRFRKTRGVWWNENTGLFNSIPVINIVNKTFVSL